MRHGAVPYGDTTERRVNGAGEGNRTLVVSLGSFCSAIELRPHFNDLTATPLTVYTFVYSATRNRTFDCHDGTLLVNVNTANFSDSIEAASKNSSDLSVG